METIGHFIDGRDVEGAARFADVYNPALGEPCARVALASTEDVDAAVAAAHAAFKKAFAEGLLIRTTGDIIALSPPLVLEKTHIDELFGKLRDVLKNLD